MSANADQVRDLVPCGCCEGLTVRTPKEIYNRPGLNEIGYRAGVHADFKASLLVRLSAASHPALRALTTRDDDDFSIAFLDAFATMADVLTFYQERIANESYLRTATERFSLLQLARMIGYELRPGVAASAFVAFSMEDPPGVDRKTTIALGVPDETTVPVGVKMQTVPRPGETAQTFETIEKIQARVDWNAIRPRLTERHPIPIPSEPDTLYFEGLVPGLKKGDGLVITPDQGEPEFRQVAEAVSEEKKNRTRVLLAPPVQAPAAGSGGGGGCGTGGGGTGGGATKSVAKFGTYAMKNLNAKVNATDLMSISYIERFEIGDLFDNLSAAQPPPPSVFALRTRAAIFGHNAPKWDALPATLRIGEYVANPSASPPDPDNVVFSAGPYRNRKNDWVDSTTVGSYPDPDNDRPNGGIFLDTSYPSIAEGSIVALRGPDVAAPFKVTSVADVSKSDFTLSAKVTRIVVESLSSIKDLSKFKIRNTTIFAQSEELPLARLPISSPVETATIELDTWVQGLFKGQKIVVCGELATESGVKKCEMAVIHSVEHLIQADGFTRITLLRSLTNSYVRDTVTILANVALATHGEAAAEILGAGDAAQPFQKFALKQPPLTYVSSPSAPDGSLSTLEVRVNDILWKEVDDFFGHQPDEQIYITRMTDDGVTIVQFGDGTTGARLPTGQDNVRAKYRKGIGTPGLVQANQISQLLDRPLGVRSVTNPIESSGAADPESRDDARRNAPLTVLTLGRIVSLRDYEDFARAFNGIGKAQASWGWTGEHRSVVLTISGPAGAEVTKDSPLYSSLLGAIHDAGDPLVPLSVEPYARSLFRLSAKVQVDPAYLPDKVLSAVEQKLRERFSFDARRFAQSVTLSEVVAAMHEVRGVVSVLVDSLHVTGETPSLNTRLDATEGPNSAAGLLTLDPAPLNLQAIA